MEQRKLGSTGVRVSALGFGGWVLGTSWYGKLTEEEGNALVRSALDLGITFFDTANSYGDDGISETLLAGALDGVSRDAYQLGTKIGYDIEAPRQHAHGERPHRWDGVFLRRSLEASLRRLRTDAVDLLELHNPRIDAIENDDCFATLDALKREGKVRSYGVALGPAIGWEEEGVRALRERKVDVVQTVYNVLEQDPGRAFLREAESAGASVLARVPHASGALEGHVTKDTVYPAGDHRSFRNRQMLHDLLDKAETLRFLWDSGDRTIAQVAVQWCLAQPRIASVLPTATTAEQLDEFASAAALPSLTDDEVARVRALYDENFGVERREYAKAT